LSFFSVGVVGIFFAGAPEGVIGSVFAASAGADPSGEGIGGGVASEEGLTGGRPPMLEVAFASPPPRPLQDDSAPFATLPGLSLIMI
jgi:hypothetical protein